jgi:hypothetical protein
MKSYYNFVNLFSVFFITDRIILSYGNGLLGIRIAKDEIETVRGMVFAGNF